MNSSNQITSTGNIRKSGTSNRGFASMDEATQRRIASQGGKAAHLKGTAHEFNSEEARLAGRKGGQSRAANAALKARMMQNSQNSSASTTGSTAIEQSSQPETRQ